jgi:hypothetical protein
VPRGGRLETAARRASARPRSVADRTVRPSCLLRRILLELANRDLLARGRRFARLSGAWRGHLRCRRLLATLHPLLHSFTTWASNLTVVLSLHASARATEAVAMRTVPVAAARLSRYRDLLREWRRDCRTNSLLQGRFPNSSSRSRRNGACSRGGSHVGLAGERRCPPHSWNSNFTSGVIVWLRARSLRRVHEGRRAHAPSTRGTARTRSSRRLPPNSPAVENREAQSDGQRRAGDD